MRYWRLLLAVGIASALGTGTASVAFAADADTSAPGAGAAGAVSVVPLRDELYMLAVDGVNVVLQKGPDGVVLVDTGPAAGAAALLQQVKQLTSQPIRFLIDTSADPDLIGGNASVAAAGHDLATTDTFDALEVNGNTSKVDLPGEGATADIIARQGVLTQMLSEPGANYGSAALPRDSFTRREFNFFLNGTPIAVVALPGGHSGSDAAVRFDRPDVVVAGAVFDQTRFPVIDLANGGSIQGEIDALDQIANTLAYAHVPVLANSGATLIIPVRGPVSDEDDLVTYRDMVATMRDRIEYYIERGQTLAQVRAEHPARGYVSRYGADSGSWTTSDFIDAVYNSLVAARKGRHGAAQKE